MAEGLADNNASSDTNTARTSDRRHSRHPARASHRLRERLPEFKGGMTSVGV